MVRTSPTIIATRILHLTDPHLFADKAGELRGATTFDTLSAVLDDYDASGWRADVVVLTGDLIQDDSAAAYEHLKTLLGRLELPVYCVPGNHDLREVMQATLQPPQFRHTGLFEADNWLVIGLDSCVPGDPGGHVSDAELDRLDAAIAATRAVHIMVCLHHPPVAVGSRWLDLVGMDNGREFLRRAGASGKVRLILFGHIHQDYNQVHAGMSVIGTPSTCRQFRKGAAEFAVDDNPPAYRRITLYTDGRFDHQRVWVN